VAMTRRPRADRPVAALQRRSALSGRLLLFIALASACVPKGRYEVALADAAVLREDVERLSLTSARLEDLVPRLQAELEASEAALEETNRKLAEKIAEAGELKGDLLEMRSALMDAEL